MFIANDTASTGWLTEKLGRKRNHITFLLRRLTVLGVPGAMKPSLFRKFTNLLDQIAVERKKEQRILHRIENVEQQHRYRLAHHQLEQIAKTYQADELEPEQGAIPDRPAQGLLWLFVLWWLFARSAINQKKQGLTVD